MRLVERSGAIEDVLIGGRGARGVRELVLRPMEYAADDLLEHVWCSRAPSSLEVLRSKYKPSRKLTATYRTRPDDVGGSALFTVTWTLESNCVRTTVLVAPADPSMSQLSRLSDADHVASLVESLTGRAASRRGRADATVIRYRPGQRHVLLVPFVSGDVYVKIDRDLRGELAVERAARLRGILARSYPRARIVEPIGWVAEDSAALWREAPGRTLSRLIRGRDPARMTALAHVGRALRTLHDATDGATDDATDGASRPPTAGAGQQDPRTEGAAAHSAGSHIAALLPCGSLYTALVGEVLEALDRLPPDSAVIAHGDFKGDNVLIDGGRLTILDLDRTCVAEPSIDLGKFLADLAWWCTDTADATALAAAFRAGYGRCDPARWARAELWAVLFDLKIAARRCAIHDPEWEIQVGRRVEAARDRLVLIGSR